MLIHLTVKHITQILNSNKQLLSEIIFHLMQAKRMSFECHIILFYYQNVRIRL